MTLIEAGKLDIFSPYKVKSIAFARVLLFLWPICSLAGVENRPLNVDEASVLNQGGVAVSVGHLYAKDNGNSNDAQINASIGILDNLELSFDLPYSFTDESGQSSNDGINDITLNAEWLVLEESKYLPSISLSGFTTLDSGDDNIGSGQTDYATYAYFSKTFEQWGVHLNAGYNFLESSDDSIFAGIAFNFTPESLAELTLVAEVWSEVAVDTTNSSDVVEVLVGSVYTLVPGIMLDVGVGTGVLSDNIDLRVTTGLTFEFDLL